MERNLNSFLKNIWKFLKSMKFGLILLAIIGSLSILGTIIPQGNSMNYYEINYSENIYGLIKAFNLDNVYSSWWFIALIGLLCLNLILCSLVRFKNIYGLIKRGPNLKVELEAKDTWIEINGEGIEIVKLFNKMGFKNIKEDKSNEYRVYYAEKNKLGYLGSWLTHLGILLIIIFFTYGKLNGFEVFFYGVPGTIGKISGTDYSLKVDDFDIKFREDFTVDQYISDISLLEGQELIDSGQVRVNHPFRTNDLNIYQNGTGWAIDIGLYKNNKLYKEKIMYQGDLFVEDNEKIALQFVNFYPDFDESSSQDLRTNSPFLNHPVMLYVVFYDGYRVDMNIAHMGDIITYEDYSFKIDNPQMFTLLQIVRDPGTKGVGLGGIILILGIFLAFYINPKKMIVLLEDNSYKILVRQNKNNDLIESKLKEVLLKLGVE